MSPIPNRIQGPGLIESRAEEAHMLKRTSRRDAALAFLSIGAAAAAPAAGAGPPRAVEIRGYNLKAGGRAEFHRLATEVTVPLLRKWKVDVVAFGPSPQDDTSYYLIRSFADAADRQRSEDA